MLLLQIFGKFQTRKILRGDLVGDVSAADIRESRTNDIRVRVENPETLLAIKLLTL